MSHLEDTHQDTVGTARTLPVCLGHNRTIGTLPARPRHCRHGRNTSRTPSSCLGHDRGGKIVVQPGCRCQPGRRRDNLVAVVITGSRRENRVAGSSSEQPGRRRVSRDVEKPTARMPLCLSGCRRVSQVAVGSPGSRSGKPGRGRDNRIAVGSAGTP